MRIFSDTIQAILDRGYGETRDAIKLVLPATAELPEIELHYTNGEDITVDGVVYQNKLRSVGTVRFSLGSAPDNTEIVLENLTRDLGFVLTDGERVVDGAEVTVSKMFKNDSDAWEELVLFIGQVVDTKIDHEKISLSIVSDMSKRGTSIGNKTATQRCIWVFNKDGSGIGPQCGWQTSQPGDPDECDHTVDGEKGCISHGNLHRIGAVPAFTAISEGSGYDANHGDGWGDGTGGGWCVHPDTYILCESETHERYWVQAFRIRAGESLVSLDRFGDFVKANVVKQTKGTTTKLHTVTTEAGYSVMCSPTHPFITSLEDTKGTPCYKLKEGDSVLSTEFLGKKYIEDTIATIEIVDYSCNVILLQLEEPNHIYIGGATTDGGILFHNLKPFTSEPFST